MLKRLIKLGILALFLHAGWRVGSEYLTYFQFRDAVRQEALRGNPTEDQLLDAVFERADEFGLELDESSVIVERDGRRTHIEGAYSRPIEIVPRYFLPWTFRWAVEVFVVPDGSSPVPGR